MHEIPDQIGGIAEKVKAVEENREKLGCFLCEAADSVELDGDVLEKRAIVPVKQDGLEKARIAAIDGGLSRHEYHGMDIILTRAVAAVFDYKNGKLNRADYFPHSIVPPKITVVSDPYSDEEFSISSSLERQFEEIELAGTVSQKLSPTLLLLDGSVVPHGNDRPGRSSPAWNRYTDVLKAFRRLFENATLLAGCIEDSRSRRFCEIMAEQVLGKISSPKAGELQKILAGTRDTNLLYYTLKRGERSAVFRYAKSSEEHPILSDLGEHGRRIFCFYLKTAEFDRPVRIDYYCKSNAAETADRIAALILAITPHSSYGFPAPLIEADFRAKLQERDADSLHDQLVDRVGITPSLMKLRREQRPF
ncbi:MAG: DNA double-strand break repair nuclease NurA [Candidatus Aenigmatarchaeota archaeon]